MNRRKCEDCIFITTKEDGLYCPRHNVWRQLDSMQITLGYDEPCDFQPNPAKESYNKE